LGGNLNTLCRNDLAKEILQTAHEVPPDQKNPSNFFYNDNYGMWIGGEYIFLASLGVNET